MNSLLRFGNDIIYVRQKNGGVSMARNAGLRMARGRYVQFVDGDDCLLQAPYDHCLDILRRQTDTDAVLFDFTHDKTEPADAPADLPPMSGAEYMRHHNLRGAVCCCLFRRAVHGKLEFTPGRSYAEDEEFTAQLLLRAEVVRTTSAKAYFYRKRSASATHTDDDAGRQKRLDDTHSVIGNLNRLADTLPTEERLAMKRRVAQLTMDYIYNTMVLTRSRKVLDERLQTLRAEGLFPLPEADYTLKYSWFRRLTNSRLGRTALVNTLPLLKRER